MSGDYRPDHGNRQSRCRDESAQANPFSRPLEAARFLAEKTLKEGGDKPEDRINFMAKRLLARPMRAEEVKVVQELLRHANSRITLDLYAQAGMPNKRLAQSKLVRMVLNKGEALA